MTVRLDQRGWTAAQHTRPCVICGRAAILRSPRGKPCHWTCAVAWVDEHQAQDDDHGTNVRRIGAIMNSNNSCTTCSGGGLVPARGCTCDGNTHTCTPAICHVYGGTGIEKRNQAAVHVQRAA